MTQEAPSEHVRVAISEAISSLGYLLPSAAADLAKILPLCFHYGPKAVATKYRKHGEQITEDEKKGIGLRRNAFYSRRAFNLLAEKGRSSPIEGIVVTLSRAGHSVFRWRSIEAAKSNAEAKIMMTGVNGTCLGCSHRNRKMVDPTEAYALPPDDCQSENCGLMFDVHIDFLASFRPKR